MPRIALFLFMLLALGTTAQAEVKTFTHFSAVLPAGWDGVENSGFTTEKGSEYMLIFKIHDAAEENIRGVVSIFLLPPLPQSAREIAEKLAAMQEDSTPPHQEGEFWAFTGEPRTQGFKSQAVTRVNVSPGNTLIVIVQDPEQLGGEAIFSSLQGLTPEAKQLLGRYSNSK